MKKSTKESGKLLVAQVYWNADQAYKLAEAKRGDIRDLALVAIPKGETVGPVEDDLGMGHWLTHGEKERVEMQSGILQAYLPSTTWLVDYCTVDVAKLKAELPETYKRMLKHESTRRTRHSCLTWGSKAPVTRRGKAKGKPVLGPRFAGNAPMEADFKAQKDYMERLQDEIDGGEPTKAQRSRT